MGIQATLTEEMKNAMRAKDVQKLSAVRMLISAIRYVQIDQPDLDEEGVVGVMKREAKKRRESILAYTEAGRTEAAEAEKYELALIETYLPKQMAEADVKKIVEETLKNGEFANFGLAMNAVMKAVGKEADGSMVARMVKESFK